MTRLYLPLSRLRLSVITSYISMHVDGGREREREKQKRKMGDVLVLGAERRAALQARTFALPPPADSLLGRLEQMDHRLRQLEEKQRVPVPAPEPQSNNYFMAELMQEMPAAAGSSGEGGEHHRHHHHHHHHHSKSMPSGFPHHQLHLKGNLMDRLHLLESRIHQLSFELDKGESSTAGAAGGTSTARQTAADNASCILPAVFAQEEEQQQPPVCAGSGRIMGGGNWKTGRIFQRSARELHSHKPKSKVKDPKEVMSSGAEKRTSAMYRSEKRRSERTRLYRRWFRVGC